MQSEYLYHPLVFSYTPENRDQLNSLQTKYSKEIHVLFPPVFKEPESQLSLKITWKFKASFSACDTHYCWGSWYFAPKNHTTKPFSGQDPQVLISHRLRGKDRRSSQTGGGKVPSGIPAVYPVSVQGWTCVINLKTPGNARFRSHSDLVIACSCGWSHDTAQARKPHFHFSRISGYPALFCAET